MVILDFRCQAHYKSYKNPPMGNGRQYTMVEDELWWTMNNDRQLTMVDKGTQLTMVDNGQWWTMSNRE